MSCMSEVSVSYSPLPSWTWAPTDFQSQVLGAHLSSLENLEYRTWGGAWTPHHLGNISIFVIVFLFRGHQPRCVDPKWVFAPPTCLVVVPSSYVQLWKKFSASLLVVLIDSYSVSGYNFGVSVGGGEFMVFLLCHSSTSPLFLLLDYELWGQIETVNLCNNDSLQWMVSDSWSQKERVSPWDKRHGFRRSEFMGKSFITVKKG